MVSCGKCSLARKKTYLHRGMATDWNSDRRFGPAFGPARIESESTARFRKATGGWLVLTQLTIWAVNASSSVYPE
jgi:hypothetical protein